MENVCKIYNVYILKKKSQTAANDKEKNHFRSYVQNNSIIQRKIKK